MSRVHSHRLSLLPGIQTWRQTLPIVALSKPTTTDAVAPTKPWTREPGGFWPDESISAPFDLPHYGPACRVEVREATGPYWPEPYDTEA
ncbi:MAG: hypothetical protein ACKV2Q_08810 [Planctomycetaceae bacterium]